MSKRSTHKTASRGPARGALTPRSGPMRRVVATLKSGLRSLAGRTGSVQGAARGATGRRESVRRAIATWPRRRRRLIAATGLGIVLALVGGTFASFRVSRSNKAKQAERAQSLQPQDAGSPSKEYIYL
jgi:hypothetical protein